MNAELLQQRVADLERENARLREELSAAGDLAAEQSRLALASIVESSDDAIIGKSLDGIIVSWNRGAERIFGYSAEEMIGRSVSALAWPGREDEMPNMLGRIRGGERVEHFETIRRHKDGRQIAVSLTVSPIRDSSGRVVGASKIARDITERRRAEEALQDVELRFRDLFENAPVSIAVIDPATGRYLECNRMFSERLGYTAEEVPDLRLLDVDPNRPLAIAELMSPEFERTGRVQFVTRQRTKSGELLDTLVTARQVRREGRICIQSIAQDISAQRQAEEALRQLGEKVSLLKEIHHRVKNNLQVVSSLLGLQSRAVADERSRKMFQESQNRIYTMALLHESLYQSDSLSRVNFRDYVKQLSAYLFQSYGAHAKGTRLQMQLDELYLSMEAAVPCGLIINELLSNSFKYAFPDRAGGELRIVLRNEPDGQALLIVSDNGIGLPDNVDWTSTRSLGLRLVRSLAEQLDARLEMESRNGTEVRLTFRAAA